MALSSGVTEPPELEALFSRPGRDWTRAEGTQVKEWLYAPRQLRALLTLAAYALGAEATAEDAEDAWEEFYSRRLDRHFTLYDPARGRRFWNFLLMCFERFCWDAGAALRKRRAREQPLETSAEGAGASAGGLELEWAYRDPSAGPAEIVEQRELLNALQRCLGALASKHRTILNMYHYEELPVAHIATVLGISESNVKVQLHRVRQKLAKCIQQTEGTL